MSSSGIAPALRGGAMSMASRRRFAVVRCRSTAVGLAVLALVASCGDGDDPASGESLASKLTRGLRFPQSMVIEAPFPEPSDDIAMLLPLGPTVEIVPEESGLIALRVEDPDARAIDATLIQFSNAKSYVRVPVEEGEGAHIVENEFDADGDLCAGLCDAVFTVTVTEAIEFEDGAISQISRRQVVVDCREHGDPDACGGPGSGGDEADALCGDVTAGDVAWSGEPVLDAHLEAVRLLGDAAGVAERTLELVREEMALALDLPGASDTEQVATALATAISEHTESGLSLLLAEQGCALTLGHVTHVLRNCDPQAEGPIALQCSGVCEPLGNAEACELAEQSGCRGLLDGEPCAGRCVGACELTLDEPAECAGTCVGTCDGECNGGGPDCEGPCSGLCTGTCHILSSDTCDGPCTGVCDAAGSGVPDCSAPLAPYCAAPQGEAIDCAGDCFAPNAVSVGEGPCSTSALAIARALPRCEPPLVQLSFGFQPDLGSAEQSDFAALVQAVNAPFAQLFDLRARLPLLIAANDELLAAAEGPIADLLADQSDSSCAAQRVPEAADWLVDQPAALQRLLDDAELLVSTLTAVE